jgi:hypothetical protein
MKRSFLLLLVIFFLLSDGAAANVSRINKDGNFSGSVALNPSLDGLVLGAEQLDLIFPILESDMNSLERKVGVSATYRVSNRTSKPIRANLQFLGLQIAEARITLNGEMIPSKAVAQESTRADFLERIIRHRYQWHPKGYEWFFHSLKDLDQRGDSRQDKRGNDSELNEMVKTAWKNANLKQIFPEVETLKALAFSGNFLPGENILVIRYEQGLFLEGHTAYSGGPVVRIGFDYLLYPARSWSLDPAFKLLLTVRIPDLIRKGWLWDSRQTLQYRTNLAFVPSYDPADKMTILTGRFQAIPADVFSVVLLKE